MFKVFNYKQQRGLFNEKVIFTAVVLGLIYMTGCAALQMTTTKTGDTVCAYVTLDSATAAKVITTVNAADALKAAKISTWPSPAIDTFINALQQLKAVNLEAAKKTVK